MTQAMLADVIATDNCVGSPIRIVLGLLHARLACDLDTTRSSLSSKEQRGVPRWVGLVLGINGVAEL